MSTAFTATYSPSDVSVVLTKGSLTHIFSGFGEDTMISVERNSEAFTMYTGADNTSTRIFHADGSGKMTVTLQQTSATNDILSQLFLNDKNTRDSSGMFQILVKDNSGRSFFSSQEAYVAITPPATFGKNMNTREWTIHLPRMEMFMGGNSKFSPEDEQAMTQLGATIDAKWRSN